MHPTQREIHVLYVDDERVNLDSFQAAFRREFIVHIANSAEAAKQILATHPIAVLITDQRMPNVTGTQLLSEAVKIYPDQVRILMSGYADTEALMNAVNSGHIFRYLKKPWDNDLVIESIRDAYALYKRKIELSKKEKELTDIKTKLNQMLDNALRDNLGLDDMINS